MKNEALVSRNVSLISLGYKTKRHMEVKGSPSCGVTSDFKRQRSLRVPLDLGGVSSTDWTGPVCLKEKQ